MAKQTSFFECQHCGAIYPKWLGQCAECGQWNSLVEQLQSESAGKQKKIISKKIAKKVIKLLEVESTSAQKRRFSTGIGELDRVLGGGLVAGSVLLLGGEPGIGKSTLLTHLVVELSSNKKISSILYLAGEESPQQIALRLERLQKEKNNNLAKKLFFVTTTDVDELIAIIEDKKPDLLIIDSIQTLSTSDLSGASGSVGQLRECTDRLIQIVKPKNIPTFLVGHVTKEGGIAGPKVLEHMVDAVLELTGERSGQLRLLRAVKNRFGATDEVGVFQAVDWGLKEVLSPTELFLEADAIGAPGSAKVCVLEGTRPLLVEVQALVVKSQLAMPRRVGRGVELSRIQVLSAVLQKHCGLPLGSYDIFLSVVGGFKLKDPAADLGLALAIASSLKNKKVSKKAVFIGEVGLLGEIRNVSYLDKRIKESKRIGFDIIYSRKSNKNLTEIIRKMK